METSKAEKAFVDWVRSSHTHLLVQNELVLTDAVNELSNKLLRVRLYLNCSIKCTKSLRTALDVWKTGTQKNQKLQF